MRNKEIAKRIWDDIQDYVLDIPNDSYLRCGDEHTTNRIIHILNEYYPPKSDKEQSVNYNFLTQGLLSPVVGPKVWIDNHNTTRYSKMGFEDFCELYPHEIQFGAPL